MHHRSALTIRQQIALADPMNKQAQRDLAISHTLLGMLLAANKRLAEGQEQIRQAVKVFADIRRNDPTNATATDDLALAHNRLGRLLMETDAQAGLEQLRQSLALAEERAVKDQQDIAPLRAIASATQHLGEHSARLAAGKNVTVTQRRALWQQARAAFQRHLQVGQRLQERGALSEGKVTSLETIRGQLAAVETAMATQGTAGQ